MNCKYCKKELKEKRKLKNFCNHSCKTKFQFLKPEQHKIRKIKIREQMKREDRKNKWSKEKLQKLTENARKISHPLLKEKFRLGTHPWQKINYNKLMAKINFISKPQMELYLLIKQKYPEAELEFPIKTNISWRFADIAILSSKLDIEYDGENWHKNKELDELRDKQLLEVGWRTIRINKESKFDIDLIK